MAGRIERIDNKVEVTGSFSDYHYLLSQIFQGIEKLGYSDIILDMQDCTAAFQNSMLPICSQVLKWRENGVDFRLIPPKAPKLYNLFRNTNWGHFLDPENFELSIFRGHTRVPATQYITSDEQHLAVNRIVNVILGALPNLERTDLAAFEWSINELTDNVLVHSESPVGGLVQVSTFHKNKKSVQFVVADPGIGVPASLRKGFPELISDTDALDRAIREGVTRDKRIGQGNGLFGSYRVCSESKGELIVDSGHARLSLDAPRRSSTSNEEQSSNLSISNSNIPYAGTLVVATIDFSDPKLLANALKFGGKTYAYCDYVETKYEDDDKDELTFVLKDESPSFGSRVSGKPVQRKLQNLLKMRPDLVIKVDFDGLPIISSSFADEAFGKLFLQLGPIIFMNRVKLMGMHSNVASIVNRAIAQRMQVGDSDVGV